MKIIYCQGGSPLKEGYNMDKNLIDEILRDIGLEHIEDDDR